MLLTVCNGCRLSVREPSDGLSVPASMLAHTCSTVRPRRCAIVLTAQCAIELAICCIISVFAALISCAA